MNHIILIISTFIVYFNTTFQYPYNDSVVLDRVITWDKLTILSLNRQLTNSKIISVKNQYKNRLSIMPFVLGSKGNVKLSKPMRFYLLIDVLEKIGNKDFFIIEVDRSGERTDIISYIICLNKDQYADIFIYHFENGKWVANSRVRKMDSSVLNGNLSRFIVKPYSGLNQDDVIISRFVKGIAVESEFYLNGTLSLQSGMKALLKLY